MLPDPVVSIIVVMFISLAIFSSVEFDVASVGAVVCVLCGEVVVVVVWQSKLDSSEKAMKFA